MSNYSIPVYVPHEGTIKISGRTHARMATLFVLHAINKGLTEIDIFYIGANAGQQAMKVMGIVRYLTEAHSSNINTVYFQPNRVQTSVMEDNGQAVFKDAVYWRPIVLNIHDLNTLLKLSKLPKTDAPKQSREDDTG